MGEKKLKICPKGHSFYKSSDCPTCPVCEAASKPLHSFLGQLSNPARRALTQTGLDTLEKLSACSEKEILKLHGIGPSSIPVLRKALEEKGFTFKDSCPPTEVGSDIR